VRVLNHHNFVHAAILLLSFGLNCRWTLINSEEVEKGVKRKRRLDYMT
jgi:hypothetical protein